MPLDFFEKIYSCNFFKGVSRKFTEKFSPGIIRLMALRSPMSATDRQAVVASVIFITD